MMGEFPLIMFTILSQVAAGAVLTLALLDYFTDKIDISTGKRSTLIIIGITAASLVLSLLHLGHPLNAYRALTNLGSSWLSREVILFSLLMVTLLIYYRQWVSDSPSRKTLGLVISIVALAAVVSSGMIYVLPAVPAWNNFSPIIFFLLTSVILGPLFILTITKFKDEQPFSGLLIWISLLLTTSFLCFVVYVSVLFSASGESGLTGMNLLENGAFWLRIAVNWILPLGLLAWGAINRKITDYKYVVSLFVLVLVGEVIGRYLFYYSAVALKVAGL